MASDDPQMTREDAAMHWGLSYLREDVQELRREIRELTRETHGDLLDLRREMNQRFNRQTATMIALAAAIIAAVKL